MRLAEYKNNPLIDKKKLIQTWKPKQIAGSVANASVHGNFTLELIQYQLFNV